MSDSCNEHIASLSQGLQLVNSWFPIPQLVNYRAPPTDQKLIFLNKAKYFPSDVWVPAKYLATEGAYEPSS